METTPTQHPPEQDGLPAVESADRQPHIDLRKLERFLRGACPPAEARAIVRHLLAGCPQCVAVTRPVWGLAERKSKAPRKVHTRRKRSRARALEVMR